MSGGEKERKKRKEKKKKKEKVNQIILHFLPAEKDQRGAEDTKPCIEGVTPAIPCASSGNLSKQKAATAGEALEVKHQWRISFRLFQGRELHHSLFVLSDHVG